MSVIAQLHLLVKPLLLHIRRAEIPVEIQAALPDGNAQGVAGEPQKGVKGGLATVLGIVGVHACREVHPLLGLCNPLGLSARLQITPCMTRSDVSHSIFR